MTSKSELKSKYKDLIRKGKKKEAFKILEQIWKMGSESKPKRLPKKKKQSSVSKKKETLSDLIKIKGIGKETIDDIKKIYSSISELKKALRADSVPLRNDIVRKLKDYLF